MSNENARKGGLLAACSMGALMFSSYVGPGFAAGTQTVAYFLTKGWIGVLVAPLLVGVLTFFWCYLSFEFNRIYKPRDFREQSDMIYHNPVARQALGIFKDVFSIVQILLVVSGMISAAATILEQMFHLPNIVGTILFAVVMIALTLKGAGLVTKVGSVLTILIIAIVIFIFVIGVGKCAPASRAFMAQRTTPKDYGFSTGYAWMIMMSVVVLYTCGSNAAIPASQNLLGSKKDSLLSALITAILCGCGTAACTFLFAAGMPEITKEPIPMLYTMQKLIGAGAWAQYVYVAIAVSAMVSTGVAMLFGVSERYSIWLGKDLMKEKSPEFRRGLVGLIITIVSVAFSRFGILAIISKGYTAFTLLAAPFLIYLLFITIPYRFSKDKKDGTFPAANE